GNGSAGALRGPVIAGCDTRDVGRMLGLGGIERAGRVLPSCTRRWEGARRDHLRGREGGVALRETLRHREACGVEETVSLVDAVVDDPDLDSLARGGARGSPELRGVDQRDTLVQQRVVLDASVDARDSR